MNKDKPEVLIVTPMADEFMADVERLSAIPIPVVACRNAEELLDAYCEHRILFGNPGIIAPLLDQLRHVEWIQSSWAGVTPLIQSARRDYILTGVKDVFGPQMSEFTLGYLLAHELKIAERSRQQAQQAWSPEHSGKLDGKTIGVMGTGSIGSHIGRTARCFNLRVIGFSRSGKAVDGFDRVFDLTEFDDFLRDCHYLVSTLPQTPETDQLLDEQAIAQLPQGAYFINVGRSNVIDDTALIKALNNGHLAGAVLDVFDTEPLPPDDPLWTTRNLHVTAHISAISHPLLIVPIFVENYQRYLDGLPLTHQIDFGTGY